MAEPLETLLPFQMTSNGKKAWKRRKGEKEKRSIVSTDSFQLQENSLATAKILSLALKFRREQGKDARARVNIRSD